MAEHPRFKDVWSWDSKDLQKIEWIGNIQSLLSIDRQMGELDSGAPLISLEEVDMSATSDPWMVLYQDANGGVSACTFVAEGENLAFYRNPLIPTIIDGDHLPYKNIWAVLSTEVRPTYESMEDVLEKIGVTRFNPGQMKPNSFGKYPMYYLQAHITVPQSINKYTIV